MLVSPFTFLRGAAEVMAHDLACTPTTGIRVQACGDAHLLNFGVFATPERHLVFDVNDFDETLPGPWEWDVKRLAASIAVAGRSVTLDPAQPGEAVRNMAWAYRERITQLSDMAPLDVWYERIDVDAVLALARKQKTTSLRSVERLVSHARHHTSLAALAEAHRMRRRTTAHHRGPAAHPPRGPRARCSGEDGRGVHRVDELGTARAARPVPHRRQRPEGRGRRERGDPLPRRADDGPRRRRAVVPPGEGGRGVRARPSHRAVGLRPPRRAGRDRSAAHAGGERHLPRAGRRGPTVATTTCASCAT